MKKIFLYLLLPASFAFGQKSQLIPDFKPQHLPPLGGYFRGKLPLAFDNSAGSQLFVDTNSLNIQDMVAAYQRSIRLTGDLVGRFSHRTFDGSSVYLIQPDHMACWIPDLNKLERMPKNPQRKRIPTDPMPNAGPRISLSPEPQAK